MKIREALDKVVVWGKAHTFSAGILVGAIIAAPFIVEIIKELVK